MSSVLESESYIDDSSALFMQRMGGYADSKAVVDLREWLQMYAFDIIGELLFGRQFEFMQDRCDFGTYIESMDSLLPPMTVASVSPTYMRPFIFPTALVFPAVRKAIEGLKNIQKAAADCVTRRRQEIESGKESRRDILDKLSAVKAEKGEKVDFGIDEIEQESYVAM